MLGKVVVQGVAGDVLSVQVASGFTFTMPQLSS